MAIRLSTGLRNAMMATNSMKQVFEATVGFVIDIYSGSQPASADDIPTGIKLVTISNNSAGTFLLFDTAAVSGSLPKSPGQTWSGVTIVAGTAGWFRIRKLDDTNAVSTTFARYDGSCATSGAQLNMGSLSIVALATNTITSASFAMPAS